MASTDDIEQVVEITGCTNRAMIGTALRAKNYDLNAVISEYYDSAERFQANYGWNEDVFASNREGDVPISNHTTAPSFIIHPPDDNQIIYGSDPGYYGSAAPSRPPSRANNRSPLSRTVDLTAGDFSGGAPNNQHEEEALLQRAISESLNTSGRHSPHSLPPPPPLPQQSGITSGGETVVQFGPANRPEYNPDEWAMVPVKRDPEATGRRRAPHMPAFLRCREQQEEKQHNLGGILMILNSIPAARNALLRLYENVDGRVDYESGYDYGSHPEWWKGGLIFPPRLQEASDNGSSSSAREMGPRWSDELRRIVAFLEATERSYGTADVLASAKPHVLKEEGSGAWTDTNDDRSNEDRTNDNRTNDNRDWEKDFFIGLNEFEAGSLFRSSYTQHYLFSPPSRDAQTFNFLDQELTEEGLAMSENIYSVLDMMFHSVHRGEPLNNTWVATITEPAEVITFRLSVKNGSGWSKTIDVPETLYIDRYLTEHREQIAEIHEDVSALRDAFEKCRQLEETYTTYVSPVTGNRLDLRTLCRASIAKCNQRITEIQNYGHWRAYKEAVAGGGKYSVYIAPHEGTPLLTEAQIRAVAWYENRIVEIQQRLENVERLINSRIIPARKEIDRLSRYLHSLLTKPHKNARWNATHPYSLRGVVAGSNTVFMKKREASLMDNTILSEQWFKVSCDRANDYAVTAEVVNYEDVMREAFGTGLKLTLVYATERTMEEIPAPLPATLQEFVETDNQFFRRELAEAEAESAQQKMSYTSTLRAVGFKKQRSDSMDSMATNKASVGGSDDNMGGFDDEGGNNVFEQEADAFMGTFDGDGEPMPDLIDVSSSPESQTAALTSPPQEMQQIYRPTPSFLAGGDSLKRDETRPNDD